MTAAYAGPYQINPLELPSNQNAAALVPAAIVDAAGTTWAASPVWTWPDVSTAARTTTAQASLAVEQARLQGQSDRVNRDITVITATP